MKNADLNVMDYGIEKTYLEEGKGGGIGLASRIKNCPLNLSTLNLILNNLSSASFNINNVYMIFINC